MKRKKIFLYHTLSRRDQDKLKVLQEEAIIEVVVTEVAIEVVIEAVTEVVTEEVIVETEVATNSMINEPFRLNVVRDTINQLFCCNKYILIYM